MCLADSSDSAHQSARQIRDDWLRSGGLLVSTNYVLDETLTLIRVRLGLHAAERWWKVVSGSSLVRWEWIDPVRDEKARVWFFRWKDKDFSITDCTSFVVMRELRLKRALTTDRHFRDAGFEIVP